MKKQMKIGLAAVAVIIVTGTGYMLLGTGGDERTTPVGQVQRVAAVVRGDLDLNVSADGVVEPIKKVEIRSKASGQIEKMNFEEGQEVKQGELLISLDQRTALNDYEQAKADLAVAEANGQQAENNFRRSEELFSKRLISEQERDQANVEYVRTKAQIVKAKAALSITDERLRDTRIASPLDGVILTKNVESGQIISSGVSNVGGGTLLATIADMNMVHVVTNVDEVDIGKVEVGQSAKVVADSYPDDSFIGEVIRIAPLGTTQQNVTMFNVIVLVRNIGGKLKAGMSASVDIEVINKPQVLLIPNEAHKDPRSEEGRTMLALRKDTASTVVPMPTDSSSAAAGAGGPGDLAAMRERLQSMSAEEREKYRASMRERFQNMSQEERQQFFARMGGRPGGSAGGSFQGGSGGQRRSQVGSANQVRRRVIMVKEGDDFVPKIIKVGQSNYDYAEVIDGLKEGDEVLVTSISQALQYNAEWSERMRSRSSVGGIGRR